MTDQELVELAIAYKFDYAAPLDATKPEDDFDCEGMEALGKRHKETFLNLLVRLRQDYPDLLALGAGGCRSCKECTYPDAPCRFPDRLVYSMEGFGLFVTQVCRDCGLEYNHGRGTMTYSGCYLLE